LLASTWTKFKKKKKILVFPCHESFGCENIGGLQHMIQRQCEFIYQIDFKIF